MLTLHLTFPWGRYYAHPWGQNPARITEAEWPPSPWRLLRAIAAAWFQANPGHEPSAELIEAMEVLGRELPTFMLPKVSFSQTVHYQPYFKKDKDANAQAKYQRARHENHFAAVGGDVVATWQLGGIDDATKGRVRTLLNDITGRITYFGRAESVCEIQVEDAVIDEASMASVSLHEGKPCRQITPSCRDVFCPNPFDFQASDLWRRRSDNATEEMAQKHLVQELIDAPQPLPDGAAWYSYRMPDGWPDRWIVRHASPRQGRSKAHRIVGHFLEFSLQCRIPVPVKHTVSIAEMFRESAIRIHSQSSYALSGHDQPEGLKIGHQHAFYLPQPDVVGQHLTRLCVWCAHGMTQREVNALMSVGAIYWAGGRFPVRPVLLQLLRDFPAAQKSHVWRSVSPFVPPRHWYRKKFMEGRVREPDSPENQFRACLRDNGDEVQPIRVERVEGANAAWDMCKVHISRKIRSTGVELDHRVGIFLNAEFAEPVTMPFPSLGHSCHFGLGQFSPVISGGRQ